MALTVGVLALQGAFIEHIQILDKLGVKAMQVRNTAQLQSCRALIIPGGESTTMIKLAQSSDLWDELIKFVHDPSKFVWGTCAGLILLSRVPNQASLGGLDVDCGRNAFGRQLGSFTTTLEIKHIGSFDATFIRAPCISHVDDGVEVLAYLEGEDAKRVPSVRVPIVAVRQGNVVGTAFHPEIGHDLRFHKFFLNLVRDADK